MKCFVFVLLCVIAAVQGRSTAVQVANQRDVASTSESPWVVHLRVAIATSGFLETCAGSLIDASWILTSADCINAARFVWLRFGEKVFEPELVLESSAVRAHQLWDPVTGSNNIGLIAVNREIENSQSIAVVPLPAEGSDVADSANLCAYGENDDNTPGDKLSCWDVEIIEVDNNDFVAKSDNAVSRFDSGAALVSDGVQIGVLVKSGERDGKAVFLRTSAYAGWIESQTGISVGPATTAAPEPVVFVDN